MTNRLFQVVVSGWVIYDSRMCFSNPITRWADAAEGPDSIVHLIAFSDLSPMAGWRIHLQTKEPSHKSAAAGRIDPPHESFQCLTLYCNFEGLSSAEFALPRRRPAVFCFLQPRLHRLPTDSFVITLKCFFAQPFCRWNQQLASWLQAFFDFLSVDPDVSLC